MNKLINIAGLQVDETLADFINSQLLPSTALDAEKFWQDFAAIIQQFTSRNESLLARRDELQGKIDDWHAGNKDLPHDPSAYEHFLFDIGYLCEDGEDFSITTENVDQEISSQPGPQLVVPVKNARFALNAANARWGSLYDALYGSDVIAEEGGALRSGGYNPVRGRKVIDYARNFLDQAFSLNGVSHSEAEAYQIVDGGLIVEYAGENFSLADKNQLVGYQGDAASPVCILLRNNGLHIEIQIDPNSEIGSVDKAGVKDVVLEAAITTIQDCEDSVAAVDAEDKVEVYVNWLGLMRGDLQETFLKNGNGLIRRLNPDRTYKAADDSEFSLPGRSLLLVRNVGHLMRNPAILDGNNNEVFEGILDGVITSAIASIDVESRNHLTNSRSGSIYIVKPKMHGPEEVQFTCDLFSAIENMLGMDRHTIKLGIMDEERRTTLNLKECIRIAKDRVVFINTGFLDRTGDEIHTSMQAGPMVPKADMKNTKWINAYEVNNVNVGLACGLGGRAQIGKGMWAMPDLMGRMVEEKIAHPRSGANTAWVPSPTAAILHAMHYHQLNVFNRQKELETREPVSRSDLLELPLLDDVSRLSQQQIQQELDNNAQGILGYVVRWVDRGIGCSKVPDIHNIGLMEDRATLRISSQHIANWLHHGVCSRQQVEETLKRMAGVVDRQNQHDPLYVTMSDDLDNSVAFSAACDLVFEGIAQPNGYTEPALHTRRIQYKKSQQ
jgi:malate synthase